MQIFIKHLKFYLLGFIIMGFFACKKEAIPKPSDFNKPQREVLGDRIKAAILNSSSTINVLSESNYATTYSFLNKMYKQASNSYRIDLGAPLDNKWDFERTWHIYIINDNTNKTCFVLPGGDIFISTNFLMNLETESELFYILAFESSLMNEGYLLNKLFSNYGTVDLKKLIDQEPSSLTIETISEEIKDLSFNSETTAQTDKKALELICASSLYKSNSLQFFLDDLVSQDQWIATRQSYPDRIETINSVIENSNFNCGNILTTGAYQTFVLDKLP